MKVEEKQDLWELVRQKLEKSNEPKTISVPDEEPVKLAVFKSNPALTLIT